MLQPFKIVDKKTGKVLTVYGDAAPTEQDQAELFDAYEKGTWKPSPPPKPFTITDEKTKLSLTVYGDEAPTKEQEQELFSAYRKGTWRPAARPVYRTDEELTAAVKNREEQGEAPEDVKTFVEQALKDRQNERTRELKSLFAAQTSSPFGAMGLANMDPALRREMLEAQTKPTPAAISETPASGQIGDIGMKVAVPLAVGIATRNPLAMAAAGGGIDMLVQQREEMRGEPVKSAPVRGTRVLTESVLTAINPPALKAGTGVVQGALTRGAQTGAMVGAGELAQQVVGQATGQDVVDIGEVFDVATLGAMFGGAFGALETAGPTVWAKIKDLKPLQALRVLLREPKTPEIEKAIQGLQQVVEQHMAPRPINQVGAIEQAVGILPPLPAPEGAAQKARTAQAEEAFKDITPYNPAEEAAKVLADETAQVQRRTRAFAAEELKSVKDFEGVVGEVLAPRPISRAAAIEGSVGAPVPSPEPVPQGYSPAAPGVEGQVAPSRRTELAQEARRLQATEAFQNLPPEMRVEEAAQLLDEAITQQERKAWWAGGEGRQRATQIAGEIEEGLVLGRLGSEETSPTPDMDRVRKADRQLAELGRRPGKAAKETARLEAQRAEAMKGVPAEPEAAAPAAEPMPGLSPQAQAILDAYEGVDVRLGDAPRPKARPGKVTKPTPADQPVGEQPVPPQQPESPLDIQKTTAELNAMADRVEGWMKSPGDLSAEELIRRGLELAEMLKRSQRVLEDLPRSGTGFPTERSGRAAIGVLANLVTGGGGFVVGWNTGEGLPPEERLKRALAFGAGGAFTPTAIRRIIGMQGWANRVIKERGVGSGALNTADPQILAALSVKGAALVGEGVKNFAEWGDKMVREFGDSIRPKLKEIWAAGQEADIIPNKLVDKAPERPLRQYETPEFKTWFGKSKVVNEDGTPKVMYHGTSDDRAALEPLRGRQKDFTVFKQNRQGLIFVTPDPEFTAGYFAKGERARIYPLYVKAENPFDYSNPSHIAKLFSDESGEVLLGSKLMTGRYVSGRKAKILVRRSEVENGNWVSLEEISDTIRKLGFDSMYMEEQGVKNLAVFDPIQLKSATGNRGTYSLRNKDIRGISTPAAMMPVAGAGAGAVIGASQGETPEEKLRYAALGAAAGAGAGAALVRGARGMVAKGISAEPRTGAVTVSKGTPQSPARSYETPAFKAWFKNSQVVNEDGTPRRMYHGTTKNNLTKFDQRSGGIWVAFDPAAASPGTGEEAGSVIPLFVSAQKIYKLSPDEFENWRMSRQPKRLAMDILNRERGNGYDAVQIEDYALVVAKPTQVKSAVSNSGAYSGMDPRIAGYITKQLAIPLGSFAGGFTYGFIEGAELPPDQRLINGLQWAAVAGGIGYAVAKRSLNSISGERVSEAAAKKLAPDAVTGDEVLEKVRKTFTPDPTELTKEQKFLTTPQAKLLQAFQNVFRPLSQVEEALVGRGEGVLLGDAASMVAGAVGKAEAALYLVQENQQKLIPQISKETLNDYLFLRRVVDRLTDRPDIGKFAKDREVAGYTLEQGRIGLDAIRKRVGDEDFIKLEEFARIVQTSADEDLKLMVRSGRMSEQAYNEIKAMNEFYAPFYVMEYFSQMDGATEMLGKGALDTTQPLTKAIKGIKDEDFKLLDIMTGFQINKMRAQVLADKNNVMRRMAELSRVDTEHRFMKDLGTKMEAKYSGEIPKGWEVVNYMEGGVKKQIAVLPEVAQAVKGMDTIRAGAFMTTLASFASPLRAGATGLNAGFQIVNVFKDAARMGIMSKYGIEKNPVDFFTFVGDLLVGATHSIRSNLLGDKSQLYLDFLKSGAARSTLAANLVPDALARAAQQGDDKTAAALLKVPLRSFISGTEKFGNAIEESIKLAGFRRGVRAEGLGKLTGKAYDDALERIAYEIRNYAGSPDFSKHGTHGKALNVLFMFANARIQGTAADLRRIIGRTGDKERNAAVVRLAAGIGTATGYLWYLNNQPDNVEDYNKRSLSERNAYFLWPRYTETGEPMYYINEEGQKVREYFRFPKFEVVGMMANVLDAGLNYAAKRDPKGIMEMGKVALENLSPIPVTGRNMQERIQSVASGLNPVFKAPLEIATNKSFFQHRDIVKQRLQGVRPEEQYLETTPKPFISLAQAMPEVAPDFLRSPLYLKQLTENFTGSMVTQFMRPQLEGRSSATTNPLVARFFAAPILDEQETWDQINGLKTEQSTKNLLRQRAIDQYIKDSASYTPAQRMQSLAQLLASDPERNAAAMYNALLDRNRGVTDVDRAVRSLEPQFRAQFLEEKVRKMETKEQRDAFYREMILKGIINDKTLEEILKLRTAPEGKKTSMKEGKLYRDPTTGVMKIYRNGAFV